MAAMWTDVETVRPLRMERDGEYQDQVPAGSPGTTG